MKTRSVKLEYERSLLESLNDLSETERKFLLEKINYRRLTKTGLAVSTAYFLEKGKCDNEIKDKVLRHTESLVGAYIIKIIASGNCPLNAITLFYEGMEGVKHAWEKFLNKDEDKIEENIKVGKNVYASFPTYAFGFARHYIATAIYAEKDNCYSMSTEKKINRLIKKTVYQKGTLPTKEDFEANKISKEMLNICYAKLAGEKIIENAENLDTVKSKNDKTVSRKDVFLRLQKHLSKDEYSLIIDVFFNGEKVNGRGKKIRAILNKLKTDNELIELLKIRVEEAE